MDYFRWKIMGNKKPSRSTLLVGYIATSLMKNLPDEVSKFANLYFQYQGLTPKKNKIKNHQNLENQFPLKHEQPTSLVDLHTDVLALIGQYLIDEKTKSGVALTNKNLYSLFYKDKPEERLLSKIMEVVATGDQERAEKILSCSPKFATRKIEYTDWCGRKFYCSPFAYAIWALDIKYMGNMIVNCLPKTAEGEEIRLELLAQLKEIQQNGLSYTLDDVKHEGEKHFDLTPLKNALQTYTTAQQNRTMTQPQATQYWCNNVGKAQKLLPVYLRQEYLCPERSFSPPKFNQERFDRTLKFTDWSANKKGKVHRVWNKELVGLGNTYAIYGGTAKRNILNGRRGARNVANIGDYESLVALEDARLNKDLPALQKRLETPLMKPDIQSSKRLKF